MKSVLLLIIFLTLMPLGRAQAGTETSLSRFNGLSTPAAEMLPREAVAELRAAAESRQQGRFYSPRRIKLLQSRLIQAHMTYLEDFTKQAKTDHALEQKRQRLMESARKKTKRYYKRKFGKRWTKYEKQIDRDADNSVRRQLKISRKQWRAYKQRLQQSGQNTHSFSWIGQQIQKAYDVFNRSRLEHPDSPVTEKTLSDFLYRVEGVLEKTNDFRKPPKEVASYGLEKAYKKLQELANESARKAALWSSRGGLSALTHTQYGQALFDLKEKRGQALNSTFLTKSAVMEHSEHYRIFRLPDGAYVAFSNDQPSKLLGLLNDEEYSRLEYIHTAYEQIRAQDDPALTTDHLVMLARGEPVGSLTAESIRSLGDHRLLGRVADAQLSQIDRLVNGEPFLIDLMRKKRLADLRSLLDEYRQTYSDKEQARLGKLLLGELFLQDIKRLKQNPRYFNMTNFDIKSRIIVGRKTSAREKIADFPMMSGKEIPEVELKQKSEPVQPPESKRLEPKRQVVKEEQPEQQMEPEEKPEPTTSVSITVVDDITGRSVTKAEVEVTGKAFDDTVDAGKYGHVTIKKIPAGQVAVMVVADGYHPKSITETLSLKNKNRIKIRMTPLHEVSVKVVNKQTGRPIEGAEVRMLGRDYYQTKLTGQDGTIKLINVPAGKYAISATADNYQLEDSIALNLKQRRRARQKVFKLTPINPEVVVRIEPANVKAKPGVPVTFKVTTKGGSKDYKYRWDWGDGRVSSSAIRPVARHVYDLADRYAVRVAAIDRKSGRTVGEASARVFVEKQAAPSHKKQSTAKPSRIYQGKGVRTTRSFAVDPGVNKKDEIEQEKLSATVELNEDGSVSGTLLIGRKKAKIMGSYRRGKLKKLQAIRQGNVFPDEKGDRFTGKYSDEEMVLHIGHKRDVDGFRSQSTGTVKLKRLQPANR